MDTQNEYFVIMKKHNRKIVEKAYQNSIPNTNYNFPKKSLPPQVYSEFSESLSLCSRVSQTYNLYQQNAMFRDFHHVQRKIAPLSSILKIKKKKNHQDCSTQRLRTLFSSKQNRIGQPLTKRKYLSLTPKKQSASKGKQSGRFQRAVGISIIRRKQPNFRIKIPIEGNPQHQRESFIETLQKMTQRCFGNNQNQNLSRQNQEAVFFTDKLVLNEQVLSQKMIKIKLSDKPTADSSPIVRQQKKKYTNDSKNKHGMPIINLRQKVAVSSFKFS